MVVDLRHFWRPRPGFLHCKSLYLTTNTEIAVPSQKQFAAQEDSQLGIQDQTQKPKLYWWLKNRCSKDTILRFSSCFQGQSWSNIALQFQTVLQCCAALGGTECSFCLSNTTINELQNPASNSSGRGSQWVSRGETGLMTIVIILKCLKW